MVNIIKSETIKLLTLPSVWIASVFAVLLPSAIFLIANQGNISLDVDAGYSALSIGSAGIIALGVLTFDQENRVERSESIVSPQAYISSLVVPSKLHLFLAKLLVLSIISLLIGIIALGFIISIAAVQTGINVELYNHFSIGRMIGILLFLCNVCLLSFGLSVIFKKGIFALTFMIVNMSAVSLGYLLTRITVVANYLPDIAGMRMWALGIETGYHMSPLVGASILLIWTFGILALSFLFYYKSEVSDL